MENILFQMRVKMHYELALGNPQQREGLYFTQGSGSDSKKKG